MPSLSTPVVQGHELPPALIAGRDKPVQTAGVMSDLVPRVPLKGLLLNPWQGVGMLQTQLSEPHSYYRFSTGTVIPTSLSAFGPYPLVHCGTTAFAPPVDVTFTAEPALPRFIVLADALPNDTLEASATTYGRPVIHDGAQEALGQLLEWTRTTPAELAPLLGSSRRTVYNWLARDSIAVRPASRIARLHSVVSQLVATRDPLLVRSWLFHGDPCPADLAAEERWEDLEQLTAQQLRPLEPSMVIGESEELSLTDVELNAALAAFAMPSSRTHQRRAGWYPREVTGIEPDDEVSEPDGT